MEFVRNCRTTAQIATDYTTVTYQAFSIFSENADIRHDQSEPEIFNLDIFRVIGHLRRRRCLVARDARSSLVWLFSGNNLEKVDNADSDQDDSLPIVEGYRFKSEIRGQIKAGDLAKATIKTPIPGGFLQSAGSQSAANSTKIPQSPRISDPKLQTSNISQSTLPPQQNDVFKIYELFITSILELLSFTMSSECGVIPLNLRTSICFQSQPLSDNAKFSLEHRLNLIYLLSLDAHWTSTGSIILSSSSDEHPSLVPLSMLNTSESSVHICRIAPAGHLVYAGPIANPSKRRTGDVLEADRRKRPKTIAEEEDVRIWKHACITWLSSHGVDLSNLDQEENWVPVKFINSKNAPSNLQATEDYEYLWPLELCFVQNANDRPINDCDIKFGTKESNRSHQYRRDSNVSEMKSETVPEHEDPVGFALDWFLSKEDRERARELKKPHVKDENEMNNFPIVSTPLNPSSPLYFRSGTQGELQPISGVYPTPPDGIATQTSATSGTGTNEFQGGTLLGSGDPNAHGIDTASQEQLPTITKEEIIGIDGIEDSQKDKEEIIVESTPVADMSGDDGNDDLFEDMDEEMFGGNGVTDADFSFFDEPSDNVIQPDADIPEPVDLFDTEESFVNSKIMKREGESHSRNAAILDAATGNQTSNNSSSFQSTAIPKDKQSGSLIESEERHAYHVSESNYVQNERPLVDATSSPPLSAGDKQPEMLPPNLKPEFQEDPANLSRKRRGSLFDPIYFSTTMNLSDSKYSSGRFHYTKPYLDVKDRVVFHRPGKSAISKFRQEITSATKYSSYPERHVRNGAGSPREISSKSTARDAKKSVMDSDDESCDSDSILSSDESITSDIGSASKSDIYGIKRKRALDGGPTPPSASSIAPLSSVDDEAAAHSVLQTSIQSLSLFCPSARHWFLLDSPASLESPAIDHKRVSANTSGIQRNKMGPPSSQSETSDADKPFWQNMTKKDRIIVAQILAYQLSQTTLDLIPDSSSGAERNLASDSASPDPRVFDPFRLARTAVKKIFEKAEECDLLRFAAVQDIYPDLGQLAKGQQRPIHRRTNTSGTLTLDIGSSQVFQISPPHVRVRRGDTVWNLLPTAINFWEPLGLSPANSSKNLMAFAIYPEGSKTRYCLEKFVENIGLSYEGAKLGSHVSGNLLEQSSGFISFSSFGLSYSSATQKLRDACVELGKELARLAIERKDSSPELARTETFIVYIVNPFQSPKSLWDICGAFWALFQTYVDVRKKFPSGTPEFDIALQLIPLKYLISCDAPTVLSQNALSKLAREVYERCSPSERVNDRAPLSIFTAPSIQLEEGVPRSIQFKLIPDPPSDLLRENSYMHVGYAISYDRSWISAAWTDNFGKYQSTVSYSLSGGRSFLEISREIWQTTLELVQARRVSWRVCIAKLGVMEKDELEAWTSLATSPTHLYLCTSLLALDTSPPFTVLPPLPGKRAGSTPTGTPQPGHSPDPQSLTPAATPSEYLQDTITDADARLVDMTDDTWMVILGHRLNNSNSTVQYRPGLVSGLLIKRGCERNFPNPSASECPYGPICTSVNLLWIGAIGGSRSATAQAAVAAFNSNPEGAPITPGGSTPERAVGTIWTATATASARATGEVLLKEIMTQYRGLGLLAKLKGLRDIKGGTIPWHLVVARNGADGLQKCV